jgi:hypothetical protein
MADGTEGGGQPWKMLEVDWTLFRAQRISELIELGFADEDAAAEARRQERRSRARFQWGLDLLDEVQVAKAEADAAWERLVLAHPELDEEALDALPDTPEQMRLDALYAQMDELIEHGRFPGHLHFHEV